MQDNITMQGLILLNPGKLKLNNIPIPALKPGHKLLKVTHCALCCTDAKMWKYGQRDLITPRILGHEICTIDQLTGQRYIIWPGVSCKNCTYCQNNAENMCNKIQIIGFNYDGGLAEFILSPEECLIPLDESLSEDIACLAEPLACAINALTLSNISANENVLIYGAGPLGLMTALLTKHYKANPFI